MSTPTTRDVIVVGSSAGGIDALSRLVADLPADLPASVLVVQHLAEESPGVLADILSRRGPLPAVMAEHAMPLMRGRIYVAPPNRHMLVGDNRIRLVFGPRENRSRPAIDPLFRTAAARLGSRVIGVILTGMLADGSSGLHAVESCGGLPIVQSPEDAHFPEMPRRALDLVPSALKVPLEAIPPLLGELTREVAPPPPAIPESLRIEVALTERAMPDDDWNQVPGAPTRFTCPACAGALQEIDEAGVPRYRCRVGHTYSGQDLVAEKAVTLEASLWAALQLLEERAEMFRNLARTDRVRGWPQTARGFERRAEEVSGHAGVLREALRAMDD